MKQLLTFLKATLLGGVIFVLPAWLAVLLVAKALTKLQVLVKPVSTHLPESVGHPRLLAVILLLALCFVIGLIIQTAIGAQVKRMVEQARARKASGLHNTTRVCRTAVRVRKDLKLSTCPDRDRGRAGAGILCRAAHERSLHRLCPIGPYADGRGPLYHRYQPCASIGPAGDQGHAVHLKMGLR